MTGVELVVAALAAGASAGLTDTASSAIRDTYAGLREAVRRRLAARGEGSARILEASEVEPGVWQAQLSEVLSASGADRDEEILATARSLLRDLGVAGSYAGANVVDAREAKGVQVGDDNTQTNTFN
ncbi:hypothetical protein HRW23_29335 [Streptomyces lunaelactis]|uniref:hypothetical protein n=1 Tax=Streptomyces lunaelactis TaxID=1535768 RepID=UPI0015856578|nr:hypothetical protein [Streptomyces lunaelactis]NUK02571.1 hypothetical protein [Streptomyces lunaelactis]NUK06466.1 hypothetical protein [Streptomyces lunaelactis]NUK20222.1 hypothetical protein [Streptomyces lunaelactis]NUK27208.1 hypothetical protein [Streptomyces lunaelactis]NUK38180.1 hypothetical protein [Streptomyces lunaelactis]